MRDQPQRSATAGGTRSARSAEAGRTARTNLRLLAAARAFSIGVEVLQLVGSLAMLDWFIGMAQRGVAGQGLVRPNEVEQAQRLAAQAASWRDAVADFSNRFQGESSRLFVAGADATTAGQTAGRIAQAVDQLIESRRELPARMTRIERARREVQAKRRAAVAILSSPSASGAVAAATFGTSKLAEVFGASEDLGRIEGSLSDALAALRAVDRTITEDINFGTAWRDTLFDACVRGGVCSQRTVTIPFVGTSTLRFLPGEDQP